jgi:hypothetical protein
MRYYCLLASRTICRMCRSFKAMPVVGVIKACVLSYGIIGVDISLNIRRKGSKERKQHSDSLLRIKSHYQLTPPSRTPVNPDCKLQEMQFTHQQIRSPELAHLCQAHHQLQHKPNKAPVVRCCCLVVQSPRSSGCCFPTPIHWQHLTAPCDDPYARNE